MDNKFTLKLKTKVTLELKHEDYKKILDIIKPIDDKLYKKILKSRDDNYVPKKINEREHYEYHEDEPEPEFEISIDSDGFWSIR